MFRHGKPRAFIHNVRLASMLSFVAGTVNIAGVLSINTLTTNVTGHFAFFAEDFARGDYRMAITYLIYILCFLAGAFFCNLLMEMTLLIGRRDPHTVPMLLEGGILIVLAFSAQYALDGKWIANALLFSMGLQNALVTKISQATVRTTHLTGLFTDLGIELSQLFFYSAAAESKKLRRSIYLRLTIIFFFFLGGVIGGFIYSSIQLRVLLFSSAALALALLYDNIRLRFHHYRRKLQHR
jgi:uncharacterized membrane protein YoaK (UPF0700 family)